MDNLKSALPIQDVFAQTNGIYLTAKQLNQLSLLFGGSIVKDGATLVDLVRRSQEVRLGDGLDFTLTTDDLWALKQQSLGMSQDFHEYVKQFVIEAVGYQLNGFNITK